MNKYILTAAAVFYTVLAHSQTKPANLTDSVKNYLDSSFSIIEKNALNRSKIDWPALRKYVYEKADHAKTYEDILPLYPYIFEQLDDHHGRLIFKNKSYYWKGNDPFVKNKVISDAVQKYTEPRSEIINKNIGYILIPGNNDFQSKHIDSITTLIKKAIAKVSSKNIKGWIIDLRTNTGGNMYPMIAGLSKLIGEGKAGSFVSFDSQPTGQWSIRNSSLYFGTTKVTEIADQGYAVPAHIPLVVLTGNYTASSGEMTAISTIGRKRSVIIGEPSGGYTTVNNGFPLNSYSGLNLAVEFAADRNNHVYPKKVTPDILVTGGDNFEDLSQDRKIQQAILWLKKN